MKTKSISTFTLLVFSLLFFSCGQNNKKVISEDKTLSKDFEYERLDESSYEIINLNVTPIVSNYHVLIKTKDLNQENVKTFLEKFRKQYGINKCNIYVYDTKDILPLTDKYPLEKQEYIKMADHFVAMTSFETPEIMIWYPFQDIQYKEYGGKNWKKEPIK